MLEGLPIAEVASEVTARLREKNVLLLAEPGAGKSTGLPLVLLRDFSQDKKIVMLEPRRLAARNVAERLASQLNEPLGRQIGLRMRGQTVVSNDTRLEVVTEGVLTRILQSDPALEGIGLVIFDEFHERSLHADLGLALCLEVQQALRPDLRLLLMSATLDSQQLVSHLEDASLIQCAGRQFPVEINWLGESADRLPQRTANAVLTALAEETGDILVFLPGVAEIERTATILAPRLASDSVLFRLHGQADQATQRAATAPASKGQRRVILSTSIAETSLTIDGVRVVVDSGLERRGRVDPSTGAMKLETVSASQASATQRSGRAGRTSAGSCYRLWSESSHSRRLASWQAEILRADLAPLLMELSLWGVSDINDLPWLEKPPEAAVARAKNLLQSLGIWEGNSLTEHGRHVAQLPIHPRLGHMVLWAAQRGVAEDACKIALLLEEPNRKSRGTDLSVQLGFPLPRHQSSRLKQLLKLLKPTKAVSTSPSTSVLVAQAYPDWIAQRRAGDEARYRLACGAGVTIDQEDPLSHVPWLSVAQLGGSAAEARVFTACRLDLEELEFWTPESFTHKNKLEWDDRAGRVVAEEQKTLGSLVVTSRPVQQIHAADKAAAMLAGISRRGLDCLPWSDDAREWQVRVQLMGSLPTHSSRHSWPPVDDETLGKTLEQWLQPFLDGVGSLKALGQLNMVQVLGAILTYQQQQEMDELLPLRYTVPSGSSIKIRYVAKGNPVLSVKLQELFGCTENPAVARGLVPLKIELLSPARRPIQITEDLANFWVNSYPAVKKEMAGRYPKHDWPVDPLSAIPTARAKPRKKPKQR